MTLPEHIRDDFSQGSLDPDTMAQDPIEPFEHWFCEICAVDSDAPNAVSLATASGLGVPSVRTVLMKLYDAKGFVFFTNYTSRKARDLEENPRGAMLFPWVRHGRQVIIRGSISRISKSESLKYFFRPIQLNRTILLIKVYLSFAEFVANCGVLKWLVADFAAKCRKLP